MAKEPKSKALARPRPPPIRAQIAAALSEVRQIQDSALQRLDANDRWRYEEVGSVAAALLRVEQSRKKMDEHVVPNMEATKAAQGQLERWLIELAEAVLTDKPEELRAWADALLDRVQQINRTTPGAQAYVRGKAE